MYPVSESSGIFVTSKVSSWCYDVSVLQVTRGNTQTLTLARYILEMSLLDLRFCRNSDSWMAAAALYLARLMKHYPVPWVSTKISIFSCPVFNRSLSVCITITVHWNVSDIRIHRSRFCDISCDFRSSKNLPCKSDSVEAKNHLFRRLILRCKIVLKNFIFLQNLSQEYRFICLKFPTKSLA